MGKGMYVGVDSKARKVKKMYVGVDGKARKVKKVYVGDANGKARLCWSGGALQYMTDAELKKLYISTDLSTWTAYDTPSYYVSKIIFAFGKYYMYQGTQPSVYSSPDGKTWTLCYTVNSTGGATINQMCFAGGILFVFKNGNYFAATSDGVNWVESSFNLTVSNAFSSQWSVFDMKYGTVNGVTGYYLLYRSPESWGYLVRWNSGTSITGFNTTAPVRLTNAYIFGGSLTRKYCAVDISNDAVFILIKIGTYMWHYKVTGSITATQLYSANTSIESYFTMLPAVNNMLRVSSNNTEMYSKTSATRTAGANMIFYTGAGDVGTKLGNRVVTSGRSATSSTSAANIFLAYTDNDGATWTQSIIRTGASWVNISSCFYGGDA